VVEHEERRPQALGQDPGHPEIAAPGLHVREVRDEPGPLAGPDRGLRLVEPLRCGRFVSRTIVGCCRQSSSSVCILGQSFVGFLYQATREHDQIVETATEARQGEPGPSVAALLTISTGLAILILAVIWFVFFRT